jgi:hypothetical protein
MRAVKRQEAEEAAEQLGVAGLPVVPQHPVGAAGKAAQQSIRKRAFRTRRIPGKYRRDRKIETSCRRERKIASNCRQEDCNLGKHNLESQYEQISRATSQTGHRLQIKTLLLMS